MLDRRRWLGCVAGGLLASPVAARDVRPSTLGRPFRIGWLSLGGVSEVVSSSPLPPGVRAAPLVDAVVSSLDDLGYVDGVNCVFEIRSANGVLDRLPRLARDLVQIPVDVILAPNTAMAIAALQATKTIPIVTIATDPVTDGLVASVAHPGGNVTGVKTSAGNTYGKMLEILKDVVPGLTRIGLLVSGGNPVREFAFRVAQDIGLTAVAGEDIRSPADVAPAFAAIVRQQAQALVDLAGPISFMARRQVSSLALASRLPGICSVTDYVDAGLLMAYGPSLVGMHRRAAVYIDKILQGAKPGDLPMEQPDRFEFALNLRTATAIGLKISPAVQRRADRVIE
jgi:putative ABC transport system substrate-binding protein